MKYLLTAFWGFLIAINVQSQATKTIYTCPMHPEVQQNQPGKCPKCGMTLIKKLTPTKVPPKKSVKKESATKKAGVPKLKKAMPKMSNEPDAGKTKHKEQDHQMEDMKRSDISDTLYTCPMHPEVINAKPGSCPKCGMTLEPKVVKQVYTCPMHPEVVSDKPGKCPKCGMTLKLKKTAGDHKHEAPMNMKDMHEDAFDFGNNDSYTPFQNFAVPVLRPTPPNANIPVGKIANKEGDISDKPVEAANSGKHFPAGTEGTKTVRYDLYISDTIVNYSGKKKKAVAVNGQIPAPTLVFTVGDTALIYVHNNGDKPSAVHWHGVQLPNRMDGVPGLTQQEIPPHTTYIYKFPVVQTGTYWYHSHFKLQEQLGLYGALIFNKRTEPNIPTVPIVLSDWSDLKPATINRYLHNANDWFAIKKNTVQSYGEAIADKALSTKLKNEWLRMHAMDVSDVYYEKFLLNGYSQSTLPQFKAGDKVRLRIVNGGASTYFWVTYSGGKLKVIANDANDVMPVDVDRFIIGPSETYDVIVSIPEDMKYELLATPEDRTKSASLWLGKGMEMPAKKLGRLDYFAGMKMMNSMMKLNGDMKPMDMPMSLQKMDMNMVMYPEMQGEQMQGHDMDNMGEKSSKEPMKNMASAEKAPALKYTCPMHSEVVSDHPGKCPKCGMTLVKKSSPDHDDMNMDMTGSGITTLNYDMLKSPHNTTLPKGEWTELKFTLEGNMNRYVWTLDNKTVSEADKILIKKGQNLRIILHNNSMMRHPMHLHGHDFRTLNQYGENSPLKNVIDIMPMETDTLEFQASESGDWFFHCHILYHMMSGMGRVFSYQNSPANPEIPDPKKSYQMLKRDDRMFHFMAENDFASNGNDGQLMYANTRWAFQGEWRVGYTPHHGYEVETHFGRYLGKMQWLLPYVGVDFRYRKPHSTGETEKGIFGQNNTHDNRQVLHAGLQYTLPFLIVADASIDHTGYFRFQLSREDIPVTRRARAMFMVNSDKEYMVGAKYIVTRNLAPAVHYDSDMGWGVGITVSY